MPSAGTFGTSGRFHLGVAVPGRGFSGGRSRLPDRVGKRQQIIRTRLLRCGGHSQAQDFPSTRNREGLCVLRAKIVRMRFRVRGQRTQDCGGLCVHVRQSGHRGLAAG